LSKKVSLNAVTTCPAVSFVPLPYPCLFIIILYVIWASRLNNRPILGFSLAAIMNSGPIRGPMDFDLGTFSRHFYLKVSSTALSLDLGFFSLIEIWPWSDTRVSRKHNDRNVGNL